MILSVHRTLVTLGAIAAAAVPFSARAQGLSVTWDPNRAIVAGSGCIKDVDAFVQAAGNDLAIIFTNLGVNLPAGARLPLAQRSACAVRVPAQIARGVYIGDLTQRITAGVIKTPGSSGSISTRTTFFNFPVPFATLSLPYGSARTAAQGPLTAQRVDRFAVNTSPSWLTGWCGSNRGTSGLYSGNIVVAGDRLSDREDVIINVDSLDVKFEVQAALRFCGR